MTFEGRKKKEKLKVIAGEDRQFSVLRHWSEVGQLLLQKLEVADSNYNVEFRSIFTRRREKLSEKAEAQQIKWLRVIDLWSTGCYDSKSDVPQSVLESRR